MHYANNICMSLFLKISNCHQFVAAVNSYNELFLLNKINIFYNISTVQCDIEKINRYSPYTIVLFYDIFNRVVSSRIRRLASLITGS